MIYLDHAATSLHKPPEVYTAVLDAMKTCASVGRSGHSAAVRAAELAFQCRCKAGELFGAKPEQVVFTTNGTHGLNIAIRSLIEPGDRVVVSGFEHNAVMRPLRQIGADIVVAGRKVFDPDDTVASFKSAVTADTKAVICTHVSNVFGYVLPVERIAALCLEQKVPLILDAAQSAGVLPVSLKALSCAYIAMPGHKGLLGPQGTGILLCGQTPKPFMSGGTGSDSLRMLMPDQLPDVAEAGTHNIPGIAGLLAGLEHLQSCGIDRLCRKERRLLMKLSSLLNTQKKLRVFYGGANVQTGLLSLQAEGYDCEIMAQKLSDMGIAVRAGLHCAPLAHQSVGTVEQGTLRVSFSAENTDADLECFVSSLEEILR